MQRTFLRLAFPAALFSVFLLGTSAPINASQRAPFRPVSSSRSSARPQAASRARTPVSVRPKGSAPDARGLRPPVFFDRNEGQTNPRVLYTAHDLGYSLFLTHAGATVVFVSPAKPGNHRAMPTTRHFSLTFLGANAHAEVLGEDELPGKSNYFSGSNPRLWHTHVPQFAKVRYRNLYPGVDVVFYSRHGRLEYDLEAAPGANLSAIRMEVSGAKMSRIAQGGIALRSGPAKFDLESPRVYQEGKTLHLIHAAYSVHGNQFGFALSGYDPARPVVIDPALIFATYLYAGCTGTSQCSGSVSDITADASGVYMVGSTTANTFPTTSGTSQATQTFVLKLDPSGANILYAAYLSDSSASAVAVDSVGSAYVAGIADEPSGTSTTFPLTQGVFSGVVPSFPANSEIWHVPYAAKLKPDGSSIIYSTLLQQPEPNGTVTATGGSLGPAKIAVDSHGALYVTGVASTGTSAWMPLPVTQGAYQTTPGNLFAMKLTPNASGLDYSTYFGGTSQNDFVDGIAVDSSGDAFLAGTAGSGFPTTSGAYQTTNPAPTFNTSAFVFELNPGGSAPVYSTFFGSTSGYTEGFGLALDSQDEAILVGYGATPPVTSGAFCGDPSGTGGAGFVAKFNSTGSALIYSTTLCTDYSSATAVALDSNGNAYVTGLTEYPATFQPHLVQPIKSYFETIGATSPQAMQVALELDTSGNPVWSTFLGLDEAGGALEDYREARIAVDPSDAVYLIYGPSVDFPTTPGAVGMSSPGNQTNAPEFLLKIAPSLGEPVGLAMPTSVTFPAQNVGTSSTAIDVQAGNYGDAAMTTTVSISGDFSETNTCGTSVPPGGKCDVQVAFTPTATGTRSGSLNFSFGGAFPTETVPLTGSGTQPAVTLSPTSLSFGQQANGTTSGAQQVTLTNTGTGSLTISSIQTSSQFGETNTCGGSVAVGGTCTIQVTFTPTASGVQKGTLTIADNAPGSPQTVSLAGNEPPTFSLSSGSSSTSATVTAGQTAAYNFSLIPADGFTGSVSFSCTGAPSGTSCSVSPNPANVTGTSPVTISVSVPTQAASTLFPLAPNTSGPRAIFEYFVATLALMTILLLCFPSARRKFSWKTAPAALAILFLLAAAAACGGGGSTGTTGSSSQSPRSNPGTAAGTYTLTVTGTSGSISQSLPFTLNVK